MDLSNLGQYKDEILKAEVGALLFNLGKTHAGIGNWKNYFPNVTQKFSSYKDYYTNKHFERELQTTDNKLRDFIFSQKLKLPNNSDIDWKEFFFGDSSSEDFIKKIFFRGCENINSGIDKGSPVDANQLNSLWLSNAFGTLKKEISDESYFDASRRCFFKSLHRYLEDNHYYNSPDWKNVRNFVLNNIKPWYSRLLSDSRFPVNDVTLFDQAYMTASMFKAVLASLYLDDSNFQSFIDNPQTIKWSILGIQYDKLGLAEKGLKAASIKWYRDASDKVDNEIKKLLEIKCPLGNEVYRDETGIYFVVGENIKGNKDGNFYKLHDELSDIKTEIQNIFTNNFGGEVYPAILLTEPSRGIMNLGYLVEKAKENFLKAEIPKNFEDNLKSQFDDNPNGICQVCKVRLARKKDKENLICDVCSDRQKGRIDNWLENSSDETIWLDELQDKNGRIALITLKFELDKWLNGDLVNSLLVQNIEFPIGNTCININSLHKNIVDGLKQNKKLNNTYLKDYHANIPNLGLRNIAERWFLERSIGSRWEEFIKNNLSDNTAIDFENRKIDWSKLKGSDFDFLSTLILQFLLRKNPSPARLRRIWEGTREFFKGLESKIIELAGIKEERCKRLMWNNIEIENGEYQDGEFLFWADNQTVYLISSIEKIENKRKFYLKKYGEHNSKPIETLEIGKAKKIDYKPYFTILSPTPVSYQFIVPAKKVPVLIKNIQEEYYKDFRWGYGKLPLHIGVVVQNYKKPLYVGIKALRKIRRDKQEWENLRKEITAEDFKARQKTAFNYQENPEQVANCENYYSLFERADSVKKAYEFYLYPDKNKKLWIDTTQNSNDNDKFYLYPNTFDFEFLDTNARRNDIYYERAKRIKKYKKQRPYDLYDWQYFEKFKEYFKDKKSSAKLQKLISIIYTKLEDWTGNESEIKTFMLSAFVNVLELKSNDSKEDFLRVIGVNKWESLNNLSEKEFIEKLYMLLDMFDFWHTMLKYDIQGGKDE